MKILVLDNYDSFTYNLVYQLKQLAPRAKVDVVRNDKMDIEKGMQYDKILLSPGPSLPDNAGILKPLIAAYALEKSILGVCLGHQAIAEVFGGKLYKLLEVRHGLETELTISNHTSSIFNNVPNHSIVGLYHSWAVEAKSLPEVLRVNAYNEDGIIMSFEHNSYDVKGLQFHPESILTKYGDQIIKNWIES